MRNPASRGLPDANQPQIVALYEALGCSVVDTHGLGFGYPDLTIGIGGVTELAEVKTEVGSLSDSQIRFSRDWRGSKVRIVRNENDVIQHVTDVRRKSARREIP